VARTVLIVDDHGRFRRLARVLLEAAGHVVVGEAQDGAGALHAARALRPDAVLLDVNLPDADGFAVARSLADLDARPRVVLTSSEDGSGFGALLAGAGALRFVPKGELASSDLGSLWDGARP